MQRLGQRMGCTEGQAWTVLLGAALAVLLACAGLPGTLTTEAALGRIPPAATTVPAPPPPPPVAIAPVATLAGSTSIPDLSGISLAATPLPAPELSPEPSEPWTPEPQVGTGAVLKAGLLDAGWGYAGTGTPIDDLDRALVPAGDLPVTARSGSVNKVSFLRLRQTGSTLRLLPVEDTGANQLQSAAALLVCPVTTRGWHGTDGQDLRTAPHYDCTAGHARSGVLQNDTSWLFDLSAVPLEKGVRELALVPAGTASDFQVVFARPAPS